MKELKEELQRAIGMVTVAMMNDLLNGEDIELTDNFTLSKHSEMDVCTMMFTDGGDEWDEVAVVMPESEGSDKIFVDVMDADFFDMDDEPVDTSVLIEKVKALIDAIKSNEAELWIPSLEYTIECIVLNEEEFDNGLDDDEEDYEEFKHNGIRKQLEELENLIKNF